MPDKIFSRCGARAHVFSPHELLQRSCYLKHNLLPVAAFVCPLSSLTILPYHGASKLLTTEHFHPDSLVNVFIQTQTLLRKLTLVNRFTTSLPLEPRNVTMIEKFLFYDARLFLPSRAGARRGNRRNLIRSRFLFLKTLKRGSHCGKNALSNGVLSYSQASQSLLVVGRSPIALTFHIPKANSKEFIST